MQEVIRIKNEHPDDKHCIVNDRVKGRLKVTRAFGAGFLKQVLQIHLLNAPINFTFLHGLVSFLFGWYIHLRILSVW